MSRRVYLVWTDVSEEHIASVFRVETSASDVSTLNIEAIYSSETSVHKVYTAHITEDDILDSNPEDGGDTFFRNVGSHKVYTAPHHRRRHSS
jgi:hypothetical protein